MQNNHTKIKILHVIESLACGGAERMLVTAFSHLNKEKFYNVVLYLYDDSYFLPEIEKLNINVYPIHLKNIYHPLTALRGISKVIKKEKIDIIHTNLFGADIYGRIAGKLSNTKCIITTLHNLAYESAANFRNRFFFKRRSILDGLTGRLFNKAFIAVSNAVKKSAEESLGFKNVNLIYNSIDLNMFSPLSPDEKKDARKTLGLKQDTIVIVTAGRLDSQKGHTFLLEALSDPKIKGKDVVLLLLGHGCLEGHLKGVVEARGIQDRVIFLGYRREVREIVGCADIFVLPAISEGFGLSLLEAMALKVPCIASCIGGIGEIIENGKTGLLVNPGCVDSLSDAILKLINDSSMRENMALNGYSRVINDFDIKKNVKLLENLYESCLN